MENRCIDCPKTKEYLDIGLSPCCGADQFFMSTKNHVAVCRKYTAEWGVSMSVTGSCYNDKLYKRFTLSIEATLSKQQLLAFSKLIDYNSLETYYLFKNNPVVLKNVPMVQTYLIRNFVTATGHTIHIEPPIGEYPNFEECWELQHSRQS